MYSVRGRWFGVFIALLLSASAVACLCVLAACDGGSPAPAASTPTPFAEASPMVGGPDTDTLGDLLTEIPNLPTSTPVPLPTGVSEADTVNIYLKVIDALLGEKLPAFIYISPYVGEGERLDDPNESQPLPEGLLPALSKGDTGPQYALMNFEDATGPLEDGGVVKNNGAFLTLGAIAADPSEGDAVVVRGSIYRRIGDAQGSRFSLKRDPASPGRWKVVDATQEWSQ